MQKSKLKNCTTCGTEIAKSAKTCPHCGAKMKKGHPILIGLLIFFVLIAVIASSGGDDEPKKIENSTPAQSTSSTPSQSEGKPIFHVGETAELRGVNVTLVGVTESTGSTYNTPTEGNVFVLCEFDIANNSNNEIAISSMLSFNAYCDDYACTYSLSALMEKGSKNQLDGTVAAGKKFNGVVGFEVPSDWKTLEVIFTPNFWSGKEITFTASND